MKCESKYLFQKNVAETIKVTNRRLPRLCSLIYPDNGYPLPV